MGFKDILGGLFKKPKKDEPPIPLPPVTKDYFSEQEKRAPSKIEDFNNEIPELPDLDIPEELGGIDKFIPSDDKPRPKVKEAPIPPPKGSGEVSLPDLPPLQFEEEIKPIKVGSPLKHEKIKSTEVNTPLKHEVVKHKTFVNKNYEYIMEDEFTKVFTNLEAIQAQASNSKKYLELIKLHNNKEKKIKEFKDIMQKVYNDLNYVQDVVFEKGDNNGR
jgi:hypothetical protein